MHVFMKIRTVIILAAVGVVAMIGEWKFVEARTFNHYRRICNEGVSKPYEGFIHQLRVTAESGDTNRLVSVLRRADEDSDIMHAVWIDDVHHNAYQRSIDEILK